MNQPVLDTTVKADHIVRLPDDWPVGLPVRIVAKPLTGDTLLDHYQPRSEIGRLALAARRAYIESGGKLLTADEINEGVRRRRGGLDDD